MDARPSEPVAKLRALLIGPPGAGKGTQAARLSAHFGVTAISTGELFRREVAAGTALGARVGAYLDQGDLVPDDLVVEAVRLQVTEAVRGTGGYLIDGFPRTIEQAEAAYANAVETGTTVHAVVTFEVGRAVLLERLVARGTAGGRSDDRATITRHRLEVYDARTAPLLDHYEQRGVLVRVDADRPVDEVTKATIELLEGVLRA